MESGNLDLVSIIGFDGFVAHGLRVHPDGTHIVYPLGNKVCIQNWQSKQQHFLSGHTDVVTAVAISPNGAYVASGQVNFMGFKANVIVWDFQSHTPIGKYEIHKVRVESITFSMDSRFVISLGGRDDCNIIVWDMETKEPICGNSASPSIGGEGLVLCRCNRRAVCFVSGGNNTLRVWRIQLQNKVVCGFDVKLGKIRRTIICIAIDACDEHIYCGTTTGDILKINLNFDCDVCVLDPIAPPALMGSYGKVPKKKPPKDDPTVRYSLGVTAIVLLPNDIEGRFIVAAGDGIVEMVKERDVNYDTRQCRLRIPSLPQIEALKTTKLESSASSLQIMHNQLLAGTKNCEMYTINIQTFQLILHVTCHTHTIYNVAFPCDFPAVFATCSKNDIRVWSSETSKELLRISVPNFTCSCIVFSHNGKAIISGWNDGVIRAFTPQTGKLMFALHNAHGKGVTALDITQDDKKIVSGGVEGEVRLWDVKPCMQTLMKVLKEHKAPVSSIAISRSNCEAISASTDGTCIIWDLCRMARTVVLFANTQFTCATFHPIGVQVLTVGTDRKVGFWEVLDGSLIRELDGSNTSVINFVEISHAGNAFVTGGCDQVLKYWTYNEGGLTHIGVGHAGAITAAKFSPDDQYVVSVSADGGIFRWRCPAGGVACQPGSSYGPAHSTCNLQERRWHKGQQNKLGDKGKDSQHEEKEDIHNTKEDNPLSKASHRSEAGSQETPKNLVQEIIDKVAGGEEQS